MIEPLLDFRLRSRDREGRAADALDLRRAFAWTFIERFSELRVAVLVAVGGRRAPERPLRPDRRDGDGREANPDKEGQKNQSDPRNHQALLLFIVR